MAREVKWQPAKTLEISTSLCHLKPKWKYPNGKTYSVCHFATWPVEEFYRDFRMRRGP